MKPLALTILALALAFFSGRVEAQVINFDIAGSGGAPYTSGASTNYSGQGVVSDGTNDYWNPIYLGSVEPTSSFNNTWYNAGTAVTSGNHLSDASTSSSVTLSLAGQDTVYIGAVDGVFPGHDQSSYTNGTPSFLELPYQFTNGGTSTDTLSGLTGQFYNLYLYSGIAGNSSSYTTAFTVGSATLDAANVSTNDDSSFESGVNYVEFTNLTPVNGKITFSFTGVGGSGDEAVFNGLQLEASPEPSVWAMMFLGLGGLVGIQIFRRSGKTCGL